MVRNHYQQQHRFDCSPVAQVNLNWECRDEIVPVLAGLQYLYTDSKLRTKVVRLIATDLNRDSRRDVGRPGMDDWQVVVLAAVRIGCNLDYDKLQDLVENHRSLRGLMGLGDWQAAEGFNFRTIGDTLRLLRPSTLEQINQAIVSAGQALMPEAAASVRGDSFVMETNIHYPTESSLILDGVRKLVPICRELASLVEAPQWRQADHLTKRIKKLVQVIGRMAASKSAVKKEALVSLYRNLLNRTNMLLERAKSLIATVQSEYSSLAASLKVTALIQWVELTEQVCETANRRVLLGETVPNGDKLFSLFETHTQLYRRGKAGQPNQYGRLVLVLEDAAGFISHYHLLDRNARDKEVVIPQMRIAQKKHGGAITMASFDRGFHSPENEQTLKKLVNQVCILPRHPGQYAERLKSETVEFRQARLRHAGIESAIGALQRGNGCERCRDRSEVGFERYLGLAILGRNIQTLGKHVIAARHETAAAAQSKRQVA